MGAIPPDHFEGGVELADRDHEWRRFSLSSARRVRLETVGDPILCDTNLTLWAGCTAGVPEVPVAFNEDRGPDDYTSVIPAEGELCLPPGSYWLDVAGFLGLATLAPFEIAIRDEGPCVVPAPDSFEPDDELALAVAVDLRRTWASPHRGTWGRLPLRTIFPPEDIDFVQFRLERPRVVRIRSGSWDNANTLLGVGYAGNGLLIGVNDDISADLRGSSFQSCLPPGRWFAVVLGRFVADYFPYELAVEGLGSCRFEQEPNGTLATATPLAVSEGEGLIHGLHTNIGGLRDLDYYRIEVPQERGLILETGGYDGRDVDTRLDLYDAQGELLATDEDGGEWLLSRLERNVPAGTYYAMVTMSSFEPPGGDTWVYSLRARLTDPMLLEAEPNDACGQGNAMAPGQRVLASISPVGDVDHYVLSVGDSSLGGIHLEVQVSSQGDPVLKVFDDPPGCSSLLGCDDDSAPGLDPLLSCCVPANATYAVQVRDFADNHAIGFYALEFRSLGECVPSGECPVAPNQLGCP